MLPTIPAGMIGNESPIIQGNVLKTLPNLLPEQRVLIVDKQLEASSEIGAEFSGLGRE
jgi:hypothetical protein